MLLEFYFQCTPQRGVGDRWMANWLVIRIDCELQEIYTSVWNTRPFRQSWLTDEICDRIGKELASDRLDWMQFIKI